MKHVYLVEGTEDGVIGIYGSLTRAIASALEYNYYVVESVVRKRIKRDGFYTKYYEDSSARVTISKAPVQ